MIYICTHTHTFKTVF